MYSSVKYMRNNTTNGYGILGGKMKHTFIPNDTLNRKYLRRKGLYFKREGELNETK